MPRTLARRLKGSRRARKRRTQRKRVKQSRRVNKRRRRVRYAKTPKSARRIRKRRSRKRFGGNYDSGDESGDESDDGLSEEEARLPESIRQLRAALSTGKAITQRKAIKSFYRNLEEEEDKTP
jgi:hypothetical protein